MKLYVLFILFISVIYLQAQEILPAMKVPVVDTFFGDYVIEDNYRYMENIHDSKTIEWLDTEKKYFKKYLNRTLLRTNSFNAINEYAYTDYDNPIKKGNYYFTYAYYNDIGVPALFYQNTLKSRPRILVDPNYISRKDNIVLKGYYVSGDSKYLAYEYSRNGSDWAELNVINLEYAEHKKDHLTGLKFSNVAWLGEGFFYSTYEQLGEFGQCLREKVFYHKLGTEQSSDKLIFTRKSNETAEFYYLVTSDEQFFVLKERNERDGKINVFYIDYKSDNPVLRPLLTNLENDIIVLDSHEGKFVAQSALNSDNGSIVLIDPSSPREWVAIASNYEEALLLNAIPFQERIVCVYQADQHPILTILDYSGKILYTREMPVATSLHGFYGNYGDEEILYSFSSFTIPPVVYKFNIMNFQTELTKMTTVTYNFSKIKYEETEYMSEDSIMVPIVLVYQEGIELDGTNPTLLEAYGGFGSVIQPSFDPGIVYFLKKGGIYAFANIRGGGDKGIEWTEAGRGLNKQNSFDDFIAAAEFLIKNKYTSSDKLAITGSSHGGLVVAAVAIQRPDLFKVAVPIVAPLDMIRKEHFTVGVFHRDEYGSVSDSLGFLSLKSYSPYNNIQENVNYPTMLVVTSENDDRVPPFHSYKFVARLQNRIAQTNPVLLKVEEKSGHNGAFTLHSSIKEASEIMGFIVDELTKKE